MQKANVKEPRHRTGKKPRQQNVPQATLHNVILCNSSEHQGVRSALIKPAGCISTLCKIAAHGAPRLCATRSAQTRRWPQAYGARRICFIFNKHLLSAAGKFISLNEGHHVPCIIFLKCKCAGKFGSTENVLCVRTSPSKKRDRLPPEVGQVPSQHENFYHKCPSGWSGPATLAKKVLVMDREVENTFL
jgi:hypothetical protein